MNAERLQDAMNFLDDDLIEETDALRRGERVIRRKLRVIRWVIPAACLALAVGAVSMLPGTMENVKNDAAIFDHMAQMAPENANGSPEYSYDEEKSFESNWQSVTCGAISLELPADWEYELIAGTDDSFYITFGTAGETALRLGYDSAFGVCGTGLREEEISIAGMAVRAGYYDDADMWSFAVFTERKPTYVIVNEGSAQWWAAHGDLARMVMDTITIDEEG